MKYQFEIISVGVVLAIAAAVHYFLNMRPTQEPATPTEPSTPDVESKAPAVARQRSTLPKTGYPIQDNEPTITDIEQPRKTGGDFQKVLNRAARGTAAQRSRARKTIFKPGGKGKTEARINRVSNLKTL